MNRHRVELGQVEQLAGVRTVNGIEGVDVVLRQRRERLDVLEHVRGVAPTLVAEQKDRTALTHGATG